MSEITATLTDTDDSTTDATEYTFTGLAIGTAGADRTVLVHGASRGTGGCTGVTVTVAGITATLDAFTGWVGTGSGTFVARAVVPTGTTADVVVTWSATVLRCAVALLVTPDAIQPHDAASVAGVAPTLTLTAKVSTAPDGLVTAVAVSPNNSGSFAWTNLDEDADWALTELLTTSVAHTRTADDAGLMVSATSTVAPLALTVTAYARAGYVPVPAWVALPWREMVQTPEYAAAADALGRVVALRAEMITPDLVPVVDMDLTGCTIDHDGAAAEQWACGVSLTGPEWVARQITDPLDTRSGLRLRLWHRLLVTGPWGQTWVEVPEGVYWLEDPEYAYDGASVSITATGRDELAILRRGGYGGATVSVGGLTVPEALRRIIVAVSGPTTPVRIDSTSTVVLPPTYELGARDPLDDMVEIADLAALTVRTDREGAILIAPAPVSAGVRADWQEGPSCPVTRTTRAYRTSAMVNSVTVVGTHPEVEDGDRGAPISVTVEDDDPTSPTWVGGYWRRRNYTERSNLVATVEAARNRATAILEGRRRPTETVQVEVPARPDLSYGDQVHLHADDPGVSGIYTVEARTVRWGGAADDPPMMTVRMASRVVR